MSRQIIHVDMDAFFAAVEQRDQPRLQGLPVVVGGRRARSRGVVSAASYEARQYGIHSAMPLAEAYRRCPQAVFLPVDFQKYRDVSRQLRRIFHRYTHLVEPLSLDEAYLDVSGQDSVAVGRELKGSIREELRLTASLGIAHNKFLAKLASDLEKPDGFTVISPQGIELFLAPLPVRRIPGVGPRSEARLHELGVSTVGHLQQLSQEFLQYHFGNWGLALARLARGEDDDPVEPVRPPKSLGEETTFSRDITRQHFLERQLAQFARDLERRLANRGLKALTVTLKIRFYDFTTLTRSHTWNTPVTEAREIYNRARALLERTPWEGRPVRLLGLTLSTLMYPEEPYQLSFW